MLRRIFIADITPPSERKNGLKDPAIGPKITIAQEAIAVPDPLHNRIQLTMKDMSVHEPPYHSRAPDGSTVLYQNSQQEKKAKAYQDMLTKELVAFIKAQQRKSQESIDARIELNGRFALPVAAVMLALVGIPLGASSRKGGRSAGYIWGIFLAFFCLLRRIHHTYTTLASARSLSAELACWLPNGLFGTAGLLLISRMERPGDRDLIGGIRQTVVSFFANLANPLQEKTTRPRSPSGRDEDRAVPVNGQLCPVELYLLLLPVARRLHHHGAGVHVL